MSPEPLRLLLAIPILILGIVLYILFARYVLPTFRGNELVISLGIGGIFGLVAFLSTYSDSRLDTWALLQRIGFGLKVFAILFVITLILSKSFSFFVALSEKKIE